LLRQYNRLGFAGIEFRTQTVHRGAITGLDYLNPIRRQENAVGVQFGGNGWRNNNRAIQVP
jgi:hypothetical protein